MGRTRPRVGRTVGRGVGGGVGRAVGRGVGGGVGGTVGRGVDGGVAVGCGVGCGVDGTVAVGSIVGTGVAVACSGVGVGRCATITSLGNGSELGTFDGSTVGGGSDDDGSVDPDGALEPKDEPGAISLADGSGDVTAFDDGATLAEGGASAIPPRSSGATNPAVSATVARMRFKRPIATTRRARCAVVTVWPGLLRSDRGTAIADRPMVAPGRGFAVPAGGSRSAERDLAPGQVTRPTARR